MTPVTFKTQVTAEYYPDGAGRHLANFPWRGSGLDETPDRAVPGGEDLDTAIEHARAALAALLRAAASGEGSLLIAEARALLATLLEHRIDIAAGRLDQDDAAAVSAWPEVALTLGRLSYDRYRDPWPQAAPPDPDDLDAACDLLLRAARHQDADERTTLYLVLALRDRQRLLPCPSDTRALTIWGERLMSLGVDPQFRPYSAAS
jgi:hypothetical protein